MERARASVSAAVPRARPCVAIRDAALRPRQRRIALLTILGPSAGTLAALALAAVRGLHALDLAWLAAGVVIGQLALEVGYHRLLAHRAFDAPRWVKIALAAGGSMTGQGRVVHWVANHRRHHVHSDTPDDPHSPFVRAGAEGPERLGLVRGLVHAQWGHMLSDGVPNGTLFARDLNADPALRRVNECYGALIALGLALPAALGLALAGPWGALSGFLWGGLVRLFVVQNVTWSVASVSHRFGARRFDTGDESRNLLWTALPSFGSGYQNNHHAFPHSARLGLRWWELDVALLAIRALAALGLARDLKFPTPAEIRAKELARAPERSP